MNKFNIRYTVIMGLLLMAAAIVFFLQRGRAMPTTKIDIRTIPLQVGQWKGEELPIDQLTTDVLETDSVLMRIYTNAQGKEVVLAVVYYQDNRVALHLPESCYSGSGSFIMARDTVLIPLFDEAGFRANRLIIRGNKGNQLALYYFETSNARTHSYKDMRWQRMMNKVRSQSNNGALIRFSAASTDSPEEDLALINDFMRELSPLLTEYLFN